MRVHIVSRRTKKKNQLRSKFDEKYLKFHLFNHIYVNKLKSFELRYSDNDDLSYKFRLTCRVHKCSTQKLPSGYI